MSEVKMKPSLECWRKSNLRWKSAGSKSAIWAVRRSPTTIPNGIVASVSGGPCGA